MPFHSRAGTVVETVGEPHVTVVEEHGHVGAALLCSIRIEAPSNQRNAENSDAATAFQSLHPDITRDNRIQLCLGSAIQLINRRWRVCRPVPEDPGKKAARRPGWKDRYAPAVGPSDRARSW
jgi:hypothetical protein